MIATSSVILEDETENEHEDIEIDVEDTLWQNSTSAASTRIADMFPSDSDILYDTHSHDAIQFKLSPSPSSLSSATSTALHEAVVSKNRLTSSPSPALSMTTDSLSPPPPSFMGNTQTTYSNPQYEQVPPRSPLIPKRNRNRKEVTLVSNSEAAGLVVGSVLTTDESPGHSKRKFEERKNEYKNSQWRRKFSNVKVGPFFYARGLVFIFTWTPFYKAYSI